MIDRALPLEHLVALTDDVGIVQHARRDVPNRSTGYCTDDVGRALIVAVEAAREPQTALRAEPLVGTYLAFLLDAQTRDGWFHTFMGYDRRWQDRRGTADAFGRAVWGLGHAAARAPRATWRAVADELFRAALVHVPSLTHLRSYAYAALGIVARLGAEPNDSASRAALRAVVEPIAAAYDAERQPGWRWCEPILTYDNARLCEALIAAATVLDDPVLRSAGLDMLDFYGETTVEDRVFVPIGNRGWFPRNGRRARFGQQPLEAAALAAAAAAALHASGASRYRELAEVAHAWFTGRNVHAATLVAGGGCCDGLDEGGVNPNMGAESTISYLLSEVTLRALARHEFPEPARIRG